MSVFHRILAKAGVSDPHQVRPQHRHDDEDKNHGFKIKSPKIKDDSFRLLKDEFKTSHVVRAKSEQTFIFMKELH